MGAGQAGGSWCLVIGSELVQSTPPEMSRGGWGQRPRTPESLECTEAKLEASVSRQHRSPGK